MNNPKMEKLYEKRRVALAELVRHIGRGAIASIAKSIDVEPNYLSRCLYPPGKTGRKNMGDELVYRLDEKYPGWIASSRSDIGLSPSSYMQIRSNAGQSQEQIQGESAMLLKFPNLSQDTITAPDGYSIKQYDAGGSMGHGLILEEQPGVIQNWSVSREWLSKNVRSHTSIDNLCIVTGFGPSMQPMFKPGDPLLVDTGVKKVIADGVYFFRVGDHGYIKQLQKIPTENGVKYVAKSKNPDFDPFDITEGMDFEVLGKVVRIWCGTDF